MKDLFNSALPERNEIKRSKQQGYAAPPGGGKKGETCKTCKHYANFEAYRKCELMRGAWNSSFGTDILARSPACKRWELTIEEDK